MNRPVDAVDAAGPINMIKMLFLKMDRWVLQASLIAIDSCFDLPQKSILIA